ncbi:PREDICTED: WD repeat-containing protein 6 [Gavialis gangeticus]|uniref:WD repeat-containing protein 6 n=1 Tax=Gavialis gangeticus TaxID=94835 RepID=UPI00092F2745|nr:PREDICTED: WD repeat-containing protein 6 [Gavialis gangeticus]
MVQGEAGVAPAMESLVLVAPVTALAFVGDLLLAARAPARCLWVRYGHQARVWAVQLLHDGLVSAGEDCACLLWSPGGDVIRSFQGHRGRGVRAVAVHEERGWLATGGMDAGTRLWHLRGDGLQQRDVVMPPGSGAPRAVQFVDPDQLLVLADVGTVHACDVASGRCSVVLEDGRFRSYGLLEVARPPGRAVLVAMGSLGGLVRVFPLEQVAGGVERQLFAGKVHSLSWALRPGRDPGTCVLFASGPEGALLWLEACCGPGGQGLVLIPRGRYLLPPCKHRWHTSAAFLPQGGFWVCGDRRGSLLLFPCSPDPAGGEGESEEPPACRDAHERAGEPPAQGPVSLLFGLHGKAGVTSVTCHEGLVYSTGRDGCFWQLRVRAGQLEELRRQRPGKGLEWVEELRFTPDGDLLVLGFHADSFVLWSTRAGALLRCLPCGGGHRSWSYHRGMATDAFAWVQARAVHVCCGQAGSSGLQVLREALHGRQVTSVRHVGAVLGPGHRPMHVLVTGSEDTTAMVLALDTENGMATPLTTLSNHISSIRALAVAAGSLSQPVPGELSALLVSAGGRAQLECYRLLLSAAPTAAAGINCQVLHVASHRLDERWDRMRNRHRVIKMDPETRYMRIAVVAGTELPPPCLVLAAACSDGSVRLFVLQEAARRLQLVAESFHHQRCVLQVEAFVHRPAGSARKHFLCSAATDGNIAFWDITATVAQALAAPEPTDEERQPWDLGAPVLTVLAHSCGVNSLHILETPSRCFLVASGSDDGSIHVCVVAVGAATTQLLLQEQLQQPSAHAAPVTGLRLLQPDLLASASVDQRLVLWRLGKAGLAFLGARFCPVADVADLDCWEAMGPGEQPGYCCTLAGQGLEVVWCQV